MMEIVECVPNFSTSDPKTVESILNEIRKTKNAFLLDATYDNYYNRLVVSFVGNKKSVLEAALNASFKAVKSIDMRKHKGQHPRIGAVDIVPFIPIKDALMEDCIELAKKFGKTLADKCGVPVYLYGDA
jgi:glutamate formiminotransferase